jgi:tetratricopeptide (TPR) repeat protein
LAVRLGTPLELQEAAALVASAEAAMWAGDCERAAADYAAAAALQAAAGANREAAMTCAALSVLYGARMVNKVAARPWHARAMRLIADEAPCVEQGYVALAGLGCDVDDPARLAEWAEMALDRARRFGDVALEMKALADGGLAKVRAGRVAEGMAMEDEAMALACAGVIADPFIVGKAVCSFYTACHTVADLERVEAWNPVLLERGIIAEGIPGPQAYSSSQCASVRGTLLCEVGRWSEADEILQNAYDDLERLLPDANWHPPIALADLRIRQGRLTEAEALLLGRDDHMEALLPMARLHLARGDFRLAQATARRGLRLIGADRVRAVALLALLVDAEVGLGNMEGAAEAAAEMDARVAGLEGVPALVADAARHRAKVQAVQGDLPAAIDTLQAALDGLAGVDLPLLRMSLHLDLARVHEAAGDQTEAVLEARAASALLARLDVILSAENTALLDRLRAETKAKPVSAPCRVATMVRDGDWWTVGCDETSVRLRDTKGMRYLAEVVAQPGVERHALDLVDVVEGVAAADTGIDRRKLGDAGELLDARSRALYRSRVAELRDEVEDALAAEDDERAAKLQAELDALIGELARAFGLGGRERKASNVAEKARLNVTRAMRKATTKLVEALPVAGAVLDRRVKTGIFCAYEPHPDDEILWSVHPPLNGTPRR